MVLAGHQDTTLGVQARAHRRLTALAGVEVLPVDPVEKLDGAADVLAAAHYVLQIQPVALDDRAVRGHRVHPMEDHMVGHEVDEDLGLDGDRVVAAVLVLGDGRDAIEPLRAVDREALDVRAEFGAVTDVVLRGVAVREFGEHLGEFGVDGGAVVALHEVLDDELPVRLDVVDDPPADLEVRHVVVLDGLHVAQPGADRADDLVLEGRRILGQADPYVPEPFAYPHAHQAVLGTADVRHPGEVGRGDQLAVQVVRPGVVRALEGPLDLAGLLGTELGAAVPADVEEGANGFVARAGDEDALAAHVHRLEGTRLGKLRGARDAGPHRLEDVLLLLGEDPGIDVVGAGESGDQAVRQAGRGHRALLAGRTSLCDKQRNVQYATAGNARSMRCETGGVKTSPWRAACASG